jgi:hypothetical protein
MVLLDVFRLSGGSPMSSRELTIAGFLVLAVVALGLYLLGRARRLDLAPLGDVMEAIRTSKAGRLALALSWAWVGWHVLAR